MNVKATKPLLTPTQRKAFARQIARLREELEDLQDSLTRAKRARGISESRLIRTRKSKRSSASNRTRQFDMGLFVPAKQRKHRNARPSLHRKRWARADGRLLRLVVDEGASDLHISVGAPPAVRLNGRLVKLELRPLAAEDTETLARAITSEANLQRVNEQGSVDFGFSFRDADRFRVSVYRERAISRSPSARAAEDDDARGNRHAAGRPPAS